MVVKKSHKAKVLGDERIPEAEAMERVVGSGVRSDTSKQLKFFRNWLNRDEEGFYKHLRALKSAALKRDSEAGEIVTKNVMGSLEEDLAKELELVSEYRRHREQFLVYLAERGLSPPSG